MTEDIQKKAIQKYGSPLYLYDMDQFRLNIDKLREHLFPESGLFFSMKANPLSAFSSIACERSCGVEIASFSFGRMWIVYGLCAISKRISWKYLSGL
jgi:diaminopimelate decarboxylase